MSKYYISNDVMFLGGNNKMVKSPSSGVHMKMNKAISFVATHPKYAYYRARNSAKGTNYVICTPMKLYGNDNNIVSDMKKARSFSSVDDAYNFINNAIDLDEDLHYVIDENFSRKKNMNVAKKEDIDPLEVFALSYGDSTERIAIPNHIKTAIFKRQHGICPFCGKKMSVYAYTIDHITPLSRGGTNHPDNLRAAHEDCNKLKGSFLDNELAKNIVAVMCNHIYNSPNSGATAMMLRSYLRGIIAVSNIK